MIVDNGDMYIPVNNEGFPVGVLFVERGFDILKLKGMTITDALVYLNKNNVDMLYRGGVKGTLKFKEIKNMKKMIMVLMIAFTMMTGLFADVKLVPEDAFNDYIVSAFEDVPFIQPQIAYVADTWEDVYEKTGVGKYGWMCINSGYCDNTDQYFLIIRVKDNGDLRWMCIEYPGDGSSVCYASLM